MKAENKNLSDLEYLVQAGFDKIAFDEKDLQEIKTQLKSSLFLSESPSYNSGLSFAFTCIICGIFLGFSFFMVFYQTPLLRIPFTAEKPIAEMNMVKHKAEIQIKDIPGVSEKFVKTKGEPNPAKDISEQDKDRRSKDTLSDMLSKTVNLSDLPSANFNEGSIKYVPNSSILFIHDLKITDYSTLYFLRNKFVILNESKNTPAYFENKEEAKRFENALEPEGKYYLHEALANALEMFAQKKYNYCLMALKPVLQFNSADLNANFYSAMCNFYNKNDKEALLQFEFCLLNANNTFLEEAEYYKALCLYQTGKKQEANNLLTLISENGGFYSEKAKAKLSEK